MNRSAAGESRVGDTPAIIPSGSAHEEDEQIAGTLNIIGSLTSLIPTSELGDLRDETSANRDQLQPMLDYLLRKCLFAIPHSAPEMVGFGARCRTSQSRKSVSDESVHNWPPFFHSSAAMGHALRAAILPPAHPDDPILDIVVAC